MTALGRLTVAASADDAMELPSVIPNLTSADIQIGDNSGAIYSIFRFTGVALLNTDTINSALINFKSSDAYTGPVTMIVKVHCEAADNSAQPTTTDNNVAGRSLTGASTDWDIHSLANDTWYQVDITTAVAEVIERGGWNTGNALSVMVVDSTCPALEYQVVYAYDDSGAANAAYLDITYTRGGATATLVTHKALLGVGL